MQCSAGSTSTLARDHGNPHDARSFEQLPPFLRVVESQEMTEAKDVRRDVEAVIITYRSIEYFPVRCISTLTTIHDSRLDLVDIYQADAEERAKVRPPLPVIFGSSPVTHDQQLRVVAPRSAVVEIIRSNGGTRRAVIPTENAMPLYKASVARILARINRMRPDAEAQLQDGVDALIDLWDARNYIKWANHVLGSPSSRKRLRHQRRDIEAKRAEKHQQEELAKQKRLMIRSRPYQDAVVLFDHVVDRFPGDRAYIFREDRS
jgi:hypothetical protein